jgi:hypothetical protein
VWQGLFKGLKDVEIEFEWNNSLFVSGDIFRDSLGGIKYRLTNIPQEVHNRGISKIVHHTAGDTNLIVFSGWKDR